MLPTLPPTSLLRQVPDPEATAPHPSVPYWNCGKVKGQTHQHVGNSRSLESRGFLKFLIHFPFIFPTFVCVRYSVFFTVVVVVVVVVLKIQLFIIPREGCKRRSYWDLTFLKTRGTRKFIKVCWNAIDKT